MLSGIAHVCSTAELFEADQVRKAAARGLERSPYAPPQRWFLCAFAHPKAKSAPVLTPNQVVCEEIVGDMMRIRWTIGVNRPESIRR